MRKKVDASMRFGHLHEKVKLMESETHGVGVFCIEPISRGTLIGEYVGDKLECLEEADQRTDRRYQMVVRDADGGFLYVIDARKKGNFTRFINSGAPPKQFNVKFVMNYGTMQVFATAIRPIKPGEELLADYEFQ
eukprot:TRINITY_DN1747_c0_g1_i1.p2 TRINITY_DN1747_c0_g1~~TRINITY_DN1747_c0_g1_i1.p2  ORF type:complete len:135 (-),score=14.98 TRINITY_DN1747_c0_g1_i1:184-588(-)